MKLRSKAMLGIVIATTPITATGQAVAQNRYFARQKLPMDASDAKSDQDDDTPASDGMATAIIIKADIVSPCIQLAEVEVMSGGRNVALASNGGRASGSAPYDGRATPNKTNDGVKPAGFPDIFHSRCDGGDQLRIDFAQPSKVEAVSGWGRGDGRGERDLYSYTLVSPNDIVGTGHIDARTGNGTSTPNQTPPLSPLPPEPKIPTNGSSDEETLRYMAWLGEVWRIRTKDRDPNFALDIVKTKSVASFMPRIVDVRYAYSDTFSRKGFGTPEHYMYFVFTDDTQPWSDFCLTWSKMVPSNSVPCSNYYINHISFYPD